MDKNLWEILVPTIRNDGRPIRTRFHRVWDAKVKEISGGLTIIPPVRGVWVNESSESKDEYHERMIPVRILATRDEMLEICEFTKNYYEQIAILAYRISTDVIYIDDGDDE